MTSGPYSDAAPLTLYVDAFFCNRFDFRCWVALMEKGVPFAASRVMVHEGQPLSAQYREQSITARVPALQHGDFWLAESLAIVDYLDEIFPEPPLYPADPQRRARARQVQHFLGSDLPALINERPSWMVNYPALPPPLSPPARADADHLLAIAARVLGGGELAGAPVAEADLAYALMRLSRSGETLPAEMTAFVAEVAARPSVKSYLDHARPPNPPMTGRRVSA